MTTGKGYQAILGLGKTGLSCIKFCLREQLPFVVMDSRENPPGKEVFLRMAPTALSVFGHFDEDLILQASRLLISPGISLKEPAIQAAIQKKIPYAGDVELFLQKIRAPVVAITGANAKSTVTALVGEMAKHAKRQVCVAGNIGIPVLDLLEEPQADWYVLELSSFQLETIFSLKAAAATVLNLSEDHMDRYASLEEYRLAKLRIYQNGRVAVINRADFRTWPLEEMPRCISFGLSDTTEGYGVIEESQEMYLTRNGAPIIRAKELKIAGRHNVENALAALALGEAIGLDEQAMLSALCAFPGLPHRCQFVGEYGQVAWYNDSKGTNVGATLAALEGLGHNKNIVLIAGGRGKGADFSPLKEPVKKYVRSLILFGEAAEELARILQGCCDVILVRSMNEAVKTARQQAKRGDIVLLSPACSSLDMFENYEHRGRVFEKEALENHS